MFGFQDLDLWLMIPDIGVRTVGKPYPRIHLDSGIAFCVGMWIRGFGFLGLDSWVWIPGFGFQDLDSLLKIPDIGVQTVGKPYPRIQVESRWIRGQPFVSGCGFAGLGFLDFSFWVFDSKLWIRG